ncbi:YgfZ/GcvT domain-containing protein [Vreelandella salicampi]|uniref:Folate-binding protein YgfZ n=1 Tax=Vreelandella salicampi TaxID=1449798 RepID=A0A7Z0LKP4_9GAMM|nr:folate-binding protein YgfZ [Halomonas salicampi]NYS60746.1 folate-binding protein YgfZ [Halomonas salicampi]
MSTPMVLASTARITHLACVDVKGEDAEKFLQGQTSAHVALSNGHFAPLTCFCTPKGRMLANAQLLRLSDNHFRLVLSNTLLEPLIAHLKKFAAFYRAELSAPGDVTLLGAATDDASVIADTLNLSLPKASWQHQSDDQGNSALCYPDGVEDETSDRWLFVLTDSAAEHFQADAEPHHWQLSDIRRGLAWLEADQQDKYLPQMLNWEALGGISFKKGCYTGQEVVARAHFRGQVKKRLARGVIKGSKSLEHGASITNAAEKTVGEVVTSAVNDHGQVEILAIINTKALEEDGELTLEKQPLALCELPYRIERLDPEQLSQTVPSQ